MSTKLLEGERALVTGCAGGIGRGIAKALKAEGATVLGSDITAPPAEDGIDFLAADLAKRDGWKHAARRRAAEARHDLACSSMPRARAASRPTRRFRVSEETWDAMTDINLRSGFFLAREVGRHMRDSGIKGRILLITSQHREMPRNLPHYSASKAGMTMVMKELARVLAPTASASTPSRPAPSRAAASSPAISATWSRKSRSAAPARRTTSHRSPSRCCRKDLVVMWWVPQ